MAAFTNSGRAFYLYLHNLAAVLWCLPWIIPPLITYVRLRHSRSLNDESDYAPENAQLMTVIVPARNEAHNIGRCVTSILSTTYPDLELVVIDDASTDGTADVARKAAGGDSRARIVRN